MSSPSSPTPSKFKMFRESSHGQLGREGGGQVVGGGGEQVGGVGEGGDGWVGQVSNLNFRTNIPSGNESSSDENIQPRKTSRSSNRYFKTAGLRVESQPQKSFEP